ncbi:MAG: hypothetical protein M0P31_14690 [Solirubrobacteraceae bacterium]|nr:hypothetical protein [Solirubrobacteraceae bacterium]
MVLVLGVGSVYGARTFARVWTGRRVGVVVAVAVVALVVPGSAGAFTAQPSGGEVVVATGDAADEVAVSVASDGRVVVEVVGQALEGPSPCAWDEEAEQLLCPAGTVLRVELGGGDDALDVSGGATVVALGGAGGDVIDGATTAYGGDGDDAISVTAGPGARGAFGEGGDDRIEVSGSTGGGEVVLEGGPGRDVLDASGASGPGIVLRGGDGPDELVGPVGPAVLDGGEGDDAIDDGGGGPPASRGVRRGGCSSSGSCCGRRGAGGGTGSRLTCRA